MRFLTIIVLNILFFQSGLAFAQDFEVSPAKLKYKIDPFESDKKVITITNHSNKLTVFRISYSDFILNDEGKIESVALNSTENSCISWLVPNNDVFEVKPNESYQVLMNMQVPVDDYKARWGYIYIQTTTERTSFSVDKDAAQTGLNLQAKIAIDVIRTPRTPQVAKIDIKDLIEIKDDKSEKEERVFSTVIENSGVDIHECNVFFIASDLSSGKEYEFERIKIKSYPGFLRKVTFTLPKTLPRGEYSLVALLDYGNKTIIKGARLNKNIVIIK